MKKIICIGECSLNVVLGADGKPLGSMVGGRVINAAVLLAAKGFEVLVASESGTDPVGDIVTDFIKSSGTDVRSLDRFTEGTTTLNVFTPDKDGAYVVTRYENYPEECFDIIWPRIDEGDIVLFGGFIRLTDEFIRVLCDCLNMLRNARLCWFIFRVLPPCVSLGSHG